MSLIEPASGIAAARHSGFDADRPGRPLCVDLDGTLIRSDLLIESMMSLLAANFLYIFLLPFWLARGKAYMKHRIAEHAPVDAALLPYNSAVVSYIEKARHERPVVLVTASNTRYAQAVAAHLGLFDAVYGSDETTNLSGKRKAALLVEKFGAGRFDYMGNGMADLAIWEHAEGAVLVDAPSRVKSAAARNGAAEVIDTPRNGWRDSARALRLHQWAKNVLVFLPLIMDHRVLQPDLLARAGLAFLAFGLCASSVYLLNDLLDLQADRQHPTKRERPFAAGSVDVWHGAVLVPVLLAVAFGIAFLLSAKFAGMLALYYLSTLAYSFSIKRMVLADVLLLAWLYTLRIIAGIVAVEVPSSFWLLAFSMFLFLSLALVKRYVELAVMLQKGSEKAAGRGYKVVDLEMLAHFGVTSGYMAVLVLALYINSDSVRLLYGRPEVIWVLCPLVLYFVSRIWLLARRGEMHDDPVVFAIRDRRSQMIAALGGLVLWLAAA